MALKIPLIAAKGRIYANCYKTLTDKINCYYSDSLPGGSEQWTGQWKQMFYFPTSSNNHFFPFALRTYLYNNPYSCVFTEKFRKINLHFIKKKKKKKKKNRIFFLIKYYAYFLDLYYMLLLLWCLYIIIIFFFL